MTVPVCTGPCATGTSRRSATLLALICLTLSLDGLMPAALASETTVAAALRLPEPASSQSRKRLEEAVFQPLTAYALDEAPVRLPADQALVPGLDSGAAAVEAKRPEATEQGRD